MQMFFAAYQMSKIPAASAKYPIKESQKPIEKSPFLLWICPFLSLVNNLFDIPWLHK